MSLGSLRPAFLEFLRNLSPQIMLLTIGIVLGSRLDLTHFVWTWQGVKNALPFAFTELMFAGALTANTTIDALLGHHFVDGQRKLNGYLMLIVVRLQCHRAKESGVPDLARLPCDFPRKGDRQCRRSAVRHWGAQRRKVEFTVWRAWNVVDPVHGHRHHVGGWPLGHEAAKFVGRRLRARARHHVRHESDRAGGA
jgi:hypothetical protein